MIMKRYFWSLIQKITELFGRFQSGGAYVLMFHNVCGDNEIPGDKSISVTASAFESFINALIAGDPKLRTLRALYTAVFGDYVGDARTSLEKGGEAHG